MDDIRAETTQRGRSVKMNVFGPDVQGLEMAALDGAREFFGPDARLEVVRDYEATRYNDYPPEKRFHANVTVTEVR